MHPHQIPEESIPIPHANTKTQKIKNILTNEVIWGVFLLLCCALILLIIWLVNRPVEWQLLKDPKHEQILISVIAGIFSVLASLMTLVQVIDHFIHYTHRPSQKRVIRILFMIPIYALTAWLSCVFLQSAIYAEFIQACYEAYIIYCFLLLLTKYLGGHKGVEEIIANKSFIKLPFPFNCCCTVPATPRWIWYIKWGLLQYAWITPTVSGIAVVLNLAGVYDNGNWTFSRGYPYITFIINFSQILAMYCLVTFYMNTKEELKPFKPLPKFLVIKAIVFFTFWQSVLMSGLAAIHVLRNQSCDPNVNVNCNGSINGFSVEQEKILLSSVLICVEMFFFSIAHHWIFGVQAYADGTFKSLMESRFQQINNSQKDDRVGSDNLSSENNVNFFIQNFVTHTTLVFMEKVSSDGV
ncbi:unnamed protein product [Didymodactylos carnosus]|uniref:Uncharacterized protein n=1 Tax=Didymodactylos carnosus TaxID=1234261 RepID=A0A814W1E5_9BILA|nr:unnamed protein product [Didymodactylos carnosus]CAF3960749.1 unnamed protein product [Didymodactylos carnosus]